VIHNALNTLHLTDIYGAADAQNTASRNVLQKAGLKFIEDFDYQGIPHVWYKWVAELSRIFAG
jgi:RimJ/RimL family protein N-acetyltransferase